MVKISIFELGKLLRSNELVVRTGLWLIRTSFGRSEEDLAGQFNMDIIDMRQVWLAQMPEGAKMAGLRQDKLLEEISNISNQKEQRDCALLFNLDLLVSNLSPDERQIFWNFSFDGMRHRPRALVYLFPYDAFNQLIDSQNRKIWEQSGRMVVS